MLSLISKQASNKKRSGQSPKHSLRPGVGIDIGSMLTKIVHFDPRQSSQYVCGAIPTLAGLQSKDLEEDESLNLELALASAPDVKRRRDDDGQLDFSTWSQSQTQSLMRRIQAALGNQIAKGTPIRSALGMSACDLRSIPAHVNETLKPKDIQSRLQEAIGDSRRRSYAVLDGQQEANRMKLLSMPETLVDDVARGLDAVGLTPESVEGIPWVLARLAPPSVGTIQLVVDWGFTYPTLVAVVDGSTQYVRRLKEGSVKKIIEPYCQKHELSQAEGARWLGWSFKPKTGEEPQPAFSDEMRDFAAQNIVQLAHGIQAAIEFMHWKNPTLEFGKITLIGGAAHLHGAEEILQRELDLEVATWSPAAADNRLRPMYAQAAQLAEGQ